MIRARRRQLTRMEASICSLFRMDLYSLVNLDCRDSGSYK